MVNPSEMFDTGMVISGGRSYSDILDVEVSALPCLSDFSDIDTRNNNDAIESFNSNSFIKLGDFLALYFSAL